ncbi:MAG: imidazole glycerol phosphate synthase subunit HisH [Candidatus Omnitrophica bacterium CG11_big_fil_rev_8_21_14_0_20_63_9]|nr:MAG: imidazole glycerol phosphate synthase subunit HisH [Candidatus Omnitrophica bacterium CG11_big_fil_rev_8_21_14_0_20_63_9]
MRRSSRPQVAIVDYGMGNLFSVKHACAYAGMEASTTSTAQELLAADAVILPGVGAFGDAMAMLARRDLVSVLRDIAASGKPLLGICLGLQLLMRESSEFGRHDGLGIIDGDVVRLEGGRDHGRAAKVPQVGWNRIHRRGAQAWTGSLLDGVPEDAYMYFVHSFYVRPVDPGLVVATTRYGPAEFCSGLRQGNVCAVQFHPERSGPDGLTIYRNLAARLPASIPEVQHA